MWPRFVPSLILFLLVLIIAMAGCQGGFGEPTPFPQPTVIAEGPEVTNTAVSSATSTSFPSPTHTGTPTEAPVEETEKGTPTAVHTPSPALSPTSTTIPTATSSPTATPTSLPQFAPRLVITGPVPLNEGVSTPATAIPTPVDTFDVPRDTTNVLLLGSDAPVGDQGVKRTDTMIIVSINRSGPTASMISLPRDLYVYIPGGTMSRLNTAITLGGVSLLKQTILYNFGIPIHYYARVDFEGFEEIVDAIGGVEVAVTCGFRDWRIKSPELDPEDEDNWEVYELEPGIHRMDGETALWYARSRLMSDDFDRGRRQQQLLRAMLNQGVDLGLVTQVPALWNTFKDRVETDMDIGRMLQIAALAPEIRENGVQNLYVLGKTTPWIVPGSNAQVQLPIWEGPGMMEETFRRLFLPPALNKATRAPILVEVINATGEEDMARLAAENLAWYGFVPIISEEKTAVSETTQLSYYAPNFKGSYNWLISWIFDMNQEEIELVDDDSSYPYNYRVILGEDYDPCLDPFFAPQSLLP